MKLTDKEQRHVRTAIRFLRFKVGGWQPLADALGLKVDSLVKVVNARGRDMTDRRPTLRRAPVAQDVPALRSGTRRG